MLHSIRWVLFFLLIPTVFTIRSRPDGVFSLPATLTTPTQTIRQAIPPEKTKKLYFSAPSNNISITDIKAMRSLLQKSHTYFKQYQLSEASATARIAIRFIQNDSVWQKGLTTIAMNPTNSTNQTWEVTAATTTTTKSFKRKNKKMHKILKKLYQMIDSVEKTLNKAIFRYNTTVGLNCSLNPNNTTCY